MQKHLEKLWGICSNLKRKLISGVPRLVHTYITRFEPRHWLLGGFGYKQSFLQTTHLGVPLLKQTYYTVKVGLLHFKSIWQLCWLQMNIKLAKLQPTLRHPPIGGSSYLSNGASLLLNLGCKLCTHCSLFVRFVRMFVYILTKLLNKERMDV